MKTKLIAWIAAVALSSGLAFADNPKIIRIGYAGVGSANRPIGGGTYANTEADWGALDNEFKAEGIEIRRTYFSGAGPAINEALANRQLDFAWQGDLPALVAKAGGLPTKLILAGSRYDAIYVGVPSTSTAKTLEDLKGKRIAVFKGTNLQLAFYNVLAARGLKETDFKLINMNTADGNAALLSGDIDAQATGADIYPLVDRGAARVVFDTRFKPRETRLSHLLVTEDFAAKYPQLVQRVVNVSLKAAAWTSDAKNKTKAYQTWVKSGFGLTSWKQDHDWIAEDLRSSPLFDEFYRAHYKRLLAKAIELKLVRRSYDIDSWLDARYLNQGLKELKLETYWPQQNAEGKVVR
jgi:sulfonate transport system substrate-binding protein